MLREYQIKAVKQIEEAFKNNKSVCYQLCTGGGKTRIIKKIVENFPSDKIIYILAHRKNLVKQLSEELEATGIKHGIIASGKPYIKYRVQVCSLQTIVKRIENIAKPELIIIDECHHSMAKSYTSIINKFPEAKILGVTATPRRTDGRGLNDIFEYLILGPSMQYLIDNNFLSEYDYYAPADVDLSNVHKQNGDYVTKEIEEIMRKRIIVGSAIEHYKKLAEGRPAIVCCVSIAHCEYIAEEFRNSGYKAQAVHSGLDDKIIEKNINGLKTGEIQLLVQCELIGEGIDIPGAECLIGLRPTMSEVIYLQHIGRVLRKSKNKAIILDHASNYKRFGLPIDDRFWSLEGKKKKEKTESKYKRCPDCMHIVNLTERVCPFCGYLWKEREDVGKKNLPKEKEGELVKITERKAVNRLIIEIARRAKTLQQAVKIAKLYGAKHTQAWYIWKKILRNN